MSAQLWRQATRALDTLDPLKRYGEVRRVTGLVIEVAGPPVFIGEVCYLEDPRLSRPIPAEVVGVREERALLMPYDYSDNVSVGTRVRVTGKPFMLNLHPAMLGRVLDGLGRPIDGKGPLPVGSMSSASVSAPAALDRPAIDTVLPSGIKVLDAFLTWGKGQRLGVFAGSGVGKSTLFGMIARGSGAEVNVIALIGERGREVKEFIERDLGEEGLKHSVVIAVPSNESPLLRVKGSETALAIAQYFRENTGQARGRDVLLLFDSLTRYAYALREIGLSLGEPPTTRGYTPSVYAAIPRLCERAGMALRGSITALFTVLVEGDDMNEPVADISRSVLDGHVTLSRRLASEGHYPPIDVLESISRVMRYVTSEDHQRWAQWGRGILSAYREAEDLINIGAYQAGNNPRIDRAVRAIETLRAFMRQGIDERVTMEASLAELRAMAEGFGMA